MFSKSSKRVPVVCNSSIPPHRAAPPFFLQGPLNLQPDERVCVVIPCYNHPLNIDALLDNLTHFDLPCYLVDDGSEQSCNAILQTLAKRHTWVTLITLPCNQGKGVAVTRALEAASLDGFTHVIQIDADGQHDPGYIDQFLTASKKFPQSIISGFRPYPQLPKGRRAGRRITDFWVCINTLSRAIQDSMCGYRLYPLQATIALLERYKVGRRMDFDTDIIVRLYWAGVSIEHVTIDVCYDSVPSHFQLLRDNLRITRMHTKHFFGMLVRIVPLVRRHVD